jgi:predicted RNA-binding Zn-ribbon protein involved in translation (DUF1610 family)
MTEPTDPKCATCNVAMHPVKLIYKQHHNKHTELEYAPPDATRSFWTGRYPVQGKVAAYLCDGCGRITLFGRPAGAELPQTKGDDEDFAPQPKTTKCFSCGEPIPETADRCPACGWSKRAVGSDSV